MYKSGRVRSMLILDVHYHNAYNPGIPSIFLLLHLYMHMLTHLNRHCIEKLLGGTRIPKSRKLSPSITRHLSVRTTKSLGASRS